MIEGSLRDKKCDDMPAENVLAFSQVGKFDITNFNLGAKNQSFHSYFKLEVSQINSLQILKF